MKTYANPHSRYSCPRDRPIIAITPSDYSYFLNPIQAFADDNRSATQSVKLQSAIRFYIFLDLLNLLFKFLFI